MIPWALAAKHYLVEYGLTYSCLGHKARITVTSIGTWKSPVDLYSTQFDAYTSQDLPPQASPNVSRDSARPLTEDVGREIRAARGGRVSVGRVFAGEAVEMHRTESRIEIVVGAREAAAVFKLDDHGRCAFRWRGSSSG